MIESKIDSLFPVPVYRAKLNRELNKEELSFVEKTKVYKNEGNKTSLNSYVLEEAPFKTLKKEANLFIKDYFSKVLSTPKTVSPYITQSWLNYTDRNEHHHIHRHSNSYLSGVIYIYADKECDQITFESNKYEQIKLPTMEWNSFNSGSWFFPVESGDVIMFPSSLSHLVTKKKGYNTRISLSFNVFVKGFLGEEENATELKI